MWIKNTQDLINLISTWPKLNNFTLVGGSALSYWLKHRYSEDLDFFSGDDRLNVSDFNNLNIHFKHACKINLIANKTVFSNTLLSKDNLIYTIQKDYLINNVKVTFYASGLDFLKNINNKIKYKNNFYIAKEEIVYTMKAIALIDRSALKDYYDIMFILKKIKLKTLFDVTHKYYQGLFNKKLFLKHLLLVNDIQEDYLPSYITTNKISKNDLYIYFKDIIIKYIKENNLIQNNSIINKLEL